MRHATLCLLFGALVCQVGCSKGSEGGKNSAGQKQAHRMWPEVSKTLWSPKWPKGFKHERTVRVEAAQVARMGRRFKATFRAVANHHLQDQLAGKPVQVNVVEAASVADARRFVRAARHPAVRNNLTYRGRLVMECWNCTPPQRYRLQQGLGLIDRGLRRYRVKARVGLLDQGKAGEVNKLYNALLMEHKGSTSNANYIHLMVSSMKFGSTVWLRLAPTVGGRSRYSFKPPPKERRELGARVAYRFETINRHQGIPWVDLEAHVTTRGFTPIAQQARPGVALTAATSHWPARASRIRSLAKQTIASQTTPMEKLKALHAWVLKKIRYGGRWAGSRDGTLQVVERGFGRCWDKSDVLITLARAAGLPARQVGGWLYGGPGHIWAEVWIQGQWIPVDATAPWLGVGGEYIPLWISENGPMPFMYLKKPIISIVSEE